ncbi:MAG: MoxR family ATPase [Chloroflexi bacterium]|nr:MoxR family ATPase [Chloroflexota bacterium]
MSADPRQQLIAVRNNVERVIVGKRREIELALLALACGGHLLVEDVPGVGKTTLAKALARSVGCAFKRVQFTPDLLPSDVTGVTIYNQKTGDFEFRPGPIVAQVVLADEINRATPKTQASLLEAMEERQITVDGVTHRLPQPFLVLATQNPIEYEGTFPLPESQLDRFMLRIRLGYPDRQDEVEIFERQRLGDPLESLGPVSGPEQLASVQRAVREVHVDGRLRHYIADVGRASREHPDLFLGASPRASLALYHASQAHALLEGRDFVTPDDVKQLAIPVLSHRLILRPSSRVREVSQEAVVAELLASLPVPGSRVPV